MTNSPTRPVRWWPAIIISVLGAAAYIRLLFSPTENRQERTFEYLLVLFVTFVLLFLWAMLFSRFTWKRKLAIFGGLIAAVLLMAGLFRIESVSGDLVPILAFRWSGAEQLETGTGSAAVTSSPDDFPQFLGQERDGRVDSGVELARDWQTNPPREVWRRQVGDSCSGFAIVGDAAVTFEQRPGESGNEQVVVRHDLETGDVVWTHSLPGTFDTVIGGNGPRSTPTIYGDQVFAFGPLGTLRALDLASGSLLWKRDVASENGAKRPEWGYASSPLIVELAGLGSEQDASEDETDASADSISEEELSAEGDSESAPSEAPTATHGPLVVVSIGVEGASLLAYDAASGEPVWQAGDDRVGYSSPVLRTIAGVPQIVVFNGASVAGHDPQSGAVLWSYEWSGDQPNVALPMVVDGDKLLVSSGYGIGSKLLALAQSDGTWTVEQIWRSPRMKAKFTNPVQHDGRIYGLDDGVMTCLDPADGSRCWKRGRYGHGQNLLIGDLIIVQAEAGDVILLEATPEGHRELGTLDALDGKSWNPPALSGRYLLVRNGDEAVCYELPTVG